MTVNTTNITSGPYDGNDVAVNFSYDFRIEDESELEVYETDDLGVQTLLTLATDYTVAGVNVDGGGLVTRVAGALPTDYVWYIRSAYPETQGTSFTSQGAFFPAIYEAALDKITFIIQQIIDRSARSIRMNDGDASGDSMILPDAADRIGKAIVFDVDGNVGVSVGAYEDQAGQAASSAAAALVSENAAASSETDAETAASNAANSEAAAAVSAASINLRTINKQSGDYTVQTSDRNKLIEYTGTGGDTLTLPLTATLGEGFEWHVKHVGTGSLTVDADTVGGTTIDEVASITLTPEQSIVVVTDEAGDHYEVTQSRGYALLADASTVSFTPAGDLASTNLQDVVEELDAEKAALAGATFTGLVNLKTGSDIASATTPDLSAATGNAVHITGTTPTTGVTMIDGQWQLCIADDAWPLTHHATNLSLQGNANYTCSAGDRLLFHYDGTTVRVMIFPQSGLGLGVGQTWEDGTGSRDTGTLYTNATGRPILVVISAASDNGVANQYIEVDGVAILTAQQSIADQEVVIQTVVPSGSTYKHTFNAGALTITHWMELR